MGRTEILKKLIESSSPSVKAFSLKSGLPYSTLRSMLERGIGNASVDNVIKVCKTLGITIEQLEEMAENNTTIIEPKENKDGHLRTIAAHFEGEEFTKEDIDDIENFIEYVKSKKKK
jgi:hypothetical protein